jgi:hypothetical protein
MDIRKKALENGERIPFYLGWNNLNSDSDSGNDFNSNKEFPWENWF